MRNFFQTINYQYPRPANFDEKNPQFDIFKDVADEKCTAPSIELVKNVRISANSVVFNYFKIFKKSCIHEENFLKYQKGYRFFLKFIFPQFNFSKKRFLLITDEWTSNYYHWHIFALKRLLLLKKRGLLENSLLFLPKKYQTYKFVLPSLARFGITKNQIVFLRRKSNIKVSETTLVETPQQHPLMFQELREILRYKASNHSDFGDKIYISREGQVLRFVENEKEVMALLEKYGFKKIIAEKLSYDEQVAICSNAKYIVSPHGAGLTNILFMPEGGAILELANAPDAHKLLTDYYKLSAMLGIEYFYQECKMGDASLKKDFHQASLVIDLQKLEENLQLMLQI